MSARLYAAAIFTLAILFVLIFATPLFIHAQSSDLQTTIRAALLSDPRTSGLSATQIDAMVEVLAEEAKKRGISSEDIQWRPVSEQTFSDTSGKEVQSCGNIPSFLCALNTAFGFNGSDPTIAIGLGVTSALLLLIIGLMLERSRRAGAAAAPLPPHFQ